MSLNGVTARWNLWPSMIASELTDAAMTLLRKHYHWYKPLRSIGIRGSNFVPIGDMRQISLFADEIRREKLERLEYAIDGVRSRFGHRNIGRALLSYEKKLGKLNAKDENTYYPVGYL